MRNGSNPYLDNTVFESREPFIIQKPFYQMDIIQFIETYFTSDHLDQNMQRMISSVVNDIKKLNQTVECEEEEKAES